MSSLHSPHSPNTSCKVAAEEVVLTSSRELLTPPPTNSSSPLDDTLLPNNFKYYTNHLNKNQFNSILIHCAINLLKILYKENKSTDYVLPIAEKEVKFFIVEILRRSKTSIQSLQLTCFYLVKLIKNGKNVSQDSTLKDPRKLFLGLLILASKFNQDYNFSFKSWLKICGISGDSEEDPLEISEAPSSSAKFNLQALRKIEVKCLTMLDYDIYLNGLNYENWCNILIIFGYDFIKFQLINNNLNNIYWELSDAKLQTKLCKWFKFFHDNLKLSNLNMIKINFNNYYLNQLGKKILIQKIPSLFEESAASNIPATFSSAGNKRCIDEVERVVEYSYNKICKY